MNLALIRQRRGKHGRRAGLAAAAAAAILAVVAAPNALAATSGTWTDTANKPTPRYDHVAARLNDGRVLVAGGVDGNSTLSAADVYSPATDQWTAAAPLLTARSAAAATTLTDGRVLVTGGTSGLPGGLKTTELYSPQNGTWSAGPNMIKARRNLLSVRLANGRVLVAGDGSSWVPTAEVYNPAKNKWTATRATGISSSFGNTMPASGVLLPDGRVLTTLGMGYYSGDGGRPSLYNPNTNSWSSVPSPSPAFLGYGAQIALLPNGHVLFAGGSDYGWGGTDEPTNVVEELDPVTGSWTQRPSANLTATSQTLTSLANGSVLLSGGYYWLGNGVADHVYDPATATWTTVAPSDGYRNTVTPLTDGRALNVGGQSTPTASQLYQP